jgi:hypothetical protein
MFTSIGISPPVSPLGGSGMSTKPREEVGVEMNNNTGRINRKKER